MRLFRSYTRKFIIIVLNIIKFILFFVGIFGSIIFMLGIDSPGIYGDYCIKYFFISTLLIVVSAFVEIFVIKYLLKDYESLHTLFDFRAYKNKKVYPVIKMYYGEEYYN